MIHAKKMVLIDQQTLDRLGKTSAGSQSNNLQTAVSSNPIKDIIIALRKEMKEILRVKDLDATEKLSRYQETLRRYLHFNSISPIINTQNNSKYQSERQEKCIPERKEFKQELIDNQQENKHVITPTNTEGAYGNRKVENSADGDGVNLLQVKLLQSLPEKKRSLARELYAILSDSNLIDWDHTGAVRVRGQNIDDSSIVELISDVVGNSKTSNPQGWQSFAGILEELKIPMKYISNVRRKKFIRSDHDEVGGSLSTSVAPKRKKQKIENQSPEATCDGSKRIKRRSTRVLTSNWKRFKFAS